MEKLYEILVSYESGETDLIKLQKNEIDEKMSEIASSGLHGKLYVVEIETLQGTSITNGAMCFYDKPQLADIVVEHFNLEISPKYDTTFYIERTINEVQF